MKVVLIHGQNHKGSSYNIARLLASNYKDADISEFFLPKDLNHFCLGCYSCIHDESKCPYFEEKKAIMNEVEKADLLIISTPTYCMRASAPMKAFIDLTFTYWMPHKPRKVMFDKKAVVISTAAGTGMKSAVKDISNTLFYWGVPYVKTYAVSVQAMNWDMVKDNKKEKIKNDISKLARKVKVGKLPHVGFKTKFMFNIMRMMQLKNWGSSEEEKLYWESQGWLGKNRPWK